MLDSFRLLQEFVEKHSDELEVIYTVSGWLKNDPQTYCVKLASKHKLQGYLYMLYVLFFFVVSITFIRMSVYDSFQYNNNNQAVSH